MTAQERVREKLVELTGYLSDLRAQQGLSWEEFQKNTMLRRGIERTLHMAIECLLDIGNLLIATQKWPAPETNRARLPQNGQVLGDVSLGDAHRLGQVVTASSRRFCLPCVHEDLHEDLVLRGTPILSVAASQERSSWAGQTGSSAFT